MLGSPPPVPRALLVAALFLAAAATSRALLGDTLADISKHRGSPTGKPEPNRAVWLFEGEDGQLLYSVTFDAAGRSIAEGLKPVRNARFNRAFVVDFIKAELEPIKGSKTTHELKVGDKYTFAKQPFTVAEDEYVVVDEPNGVLIVWNQGRPPSVMAVTPAALQ